MIKFVKENLSELNWIFFLTLLSLALYQCVFRYWNYFSHRNIKFIRGLPVFGTNYKSLFSRESVVQAYSNAYYAFPKEKFIGMYEVLGKPSFFIRDPDLIKQICITDFNHFVNHRFFMDETVDPLFGRNLILLRDNRWREMRATLSPAFTGSKMRLMLSLMNECAKDFCQQFKESIHNKSADVDLKDLFTRYASDTIANCAFGMKTSSIKNRNDSFYQRCLKITNFEGILALKFMACSSIPGIMKFFKIQVFSDETAQYFREIVLNNAKYREENNVVRHDMIHLLMEAKKGLLTHGSAEEEEQYASAGFTTVEESLIGKSDRKIQSWHDDDMVAQCIVFFIAGYTSISTVKCFLAHELAVNPDIQKKLYEEIKEINDRINGAPITYEILQNMKYMDMVVSETLRRWTVGTATERYCNKPYIIESTDGTKVQLNIGDAVWIPEAALHMDPQYFPNPSKFDPERFNDENKHNIRSGVFAPFGLGPRNCIGSRFALMEIKSLFYHLLLEFSLEKCAKTATTLKLKSRTTFTMDVESGFHVEIKPRIK